MSGLSTFEKAAEAGFSALDAMASEEIGGEAEIPKGLAFPGFSPEDGDWTWRDLPRAIVGVLDKQRFLATTAGFWVAFVIYGLLDWLGGLLGAKVALLGTIFGVLGDLVLVGAVALVASVMGFVCHQTVVEQRPSSIKAGIEWTRARLKAVVGTPLAFVGVVLAAGVIEGAIGAVGRIPFVGPIIWGALSPITVALSLAAGAVAVALVYCLPLYIPVIYNEQTGPIDTLKRLLGLFRDHGFKLVGYVLASVAMVVAAFSVTLLPVWIVAAKITGGVGGAAMGENLSGLVMEAPGGVFKSYIISAAEPSGWTFMADTGFGHWLGGLFAGIGSALLLAVLCAAVALTYYTAGAIIYAIITGRKKVSESAS